MDDNGNVLFRTGSDNEKQDWSHAIGSYRARGIRILGIIPSPNEVCLAFPDATLRDLDRYLPVAGVHDMELL